MRLDSQLPALLAVLASVVAAGCGSAVAAAGQGSTIAGVITTEDGRALTSGAVTMIRTRSGGSSSAPTEDVTILPDGSFSFRNVPAGSYQIRARGETEANGIARFAAFNVVADGRDVTDITMVLQPGASVAGTVIVEGTRSARPVELRRLRVRAPLADGSGFGEALTGAVLQTGAYAIRGLLPGPHVVTIEGLQEPWVLKAVTYRGQDISDIGITAESRQRLEDVRVTITDQASEISGAVRNVKGEAAAGATVVFAPTSPRFWTRTSRRFKIVRADGTGRYRVRGLPPGEYRAFAGVDLDDESLYRPGAIKALSEAGTPLTIAALERRVLDLAARPPAGPSSR